MDEPLQHREEPTVNDVEGRARLMDRKRRLAEAFPLSGRSPEHEGPAVRIEPGKQEDLRYMRGWLASSEWLDRLIAATDPEAAADTEPPYSPGLHLAVRAVPKEGRGLLEWSGNALPARLSES
jgi:hypothetical protein